MVRYANTFSCLGKDQPRKRSIFSSFHVFYLIRLRRLDNMHDAELCINGKAVPLHAMGALGGEEL
jgi:hypothetical protein